jgi:hypothetical protein
LGQRFEVALHTPTPRRRRRRRRRWGRGWASQSNGDRSVWVGQLRAQHLPGRDGVRQSRGWRLRGGRRRRRGSSGDSPGQKERHCAIDVESLGTESTLALLDRESHFGETGDGLNEVWRVARKGDRRPRRRGGRHRQRRWRGRWTDRGQWRYRRQIGRRWRGGRKGLRDPPRQTGIRRPFYIVSLRTHRTFAPLDRESHLNEGRDERTEVGRVAGKADRRPLRRGGRRRRWRGLRTDRRRWRWRRRI